MKIKLYQFQPKTHFGLTYWASIVHMKILTKVKTIFLDNIYTLANVIISYTMRTNLPKTLDQLINW